MDIVLAHTQGFCAGVAMAVDVVEEALKKYGSPVYVRHHIVHNNAVIEDFEKRGVVFVENIEDVPKGKTVILSAHGSAPNIYEKAKEKQINCIDATCPLVTKVHRNAMRFSKRNVQTVLIGHRGHQELIGTSGYVKKDLLNVIETESDIEDLQLDETKPIGFLTQTTLSVSDTTNMISALKKKYTNIMGAKKADICFATQNRQDAVSELSKICDVIIICGSPHSSNSNRLKELAEQLGVTSYIIDTVKELKIEWVKNAKKVGISSGASVPRKTVDQVVEALKEAYSTANIIEEESVEKGIYFKLPTI